MGTRSIMALNVEEIDLAEVVSALRESFEGSLPTGYVRGRTALRDAVSDRLGCSTAEAGETADGNGGSPLPV
jgi:hypothetical protein